MTTETESLTAEDLYRMRLPEGRAELIDGVLVELGPEAYESGEIAAEVAGRLREHTKPRGLGRVVTGDPGFVLARQPDRVRAADVAFIAAMRVPSGEQRRRFVEGAPDLVVEVVSPSDLAQDLHAKALEWLAGGAQTVWVLFPENRTVMVYRPEHEVSLLTEGETLIGAPVLPDFSVLVRELFQ